MQFGETLLNNLKQTDKMAKIRERWDHGIFVGVRRRSGEVWISTGDKVFGARSIRRISVAERWTDDSLKWVNRVPWHRYKDAGDADGDVLEGVEAEERPERPDDAAKVVFIETKERAQREFYIRKADAEKHGYTRGCQGCSNWFRGLGRQPYSETKSGKKIRD